MAKNKFDHKPKGAECLGQALADAARIPLINKAMKDYQFNNSVLHPKPTEYLLAQLLGVDADWVSLFEAAYSGILHGGLLVGIEEHPAVQLAQAMITQRYGLIPHPTFGHAGKMIPNHPIVEAKKKYFAEYGYKKLG